MRYEGKTAPSVSWVKATVGVVIIGLLLLVVNETDAHASQSQTLQTNGSPLCFKWHFREFRDGLFVSGMLWEITQDATWCNDGHGHFSGGPPQVFHNHREGSSWNFGGWDNITAQHKTNPSRWFFRVDATEVGNATGVFNEHNYPYIRLTIYPNPGQATWAASCGCKATTVKR